MGWQEQARVAVHTSRLVVVAHGAWVQWRVTPVSKSLLACKQRGPVITGLHALVLFLNMRSAGIIGGARSCCASSSGMGQQS